MALPEPQLRAAFRALNRNMLLLSHSVRWQMANPMTGAADPPGSIAASTLASWIAPWHW